MTVWDRRPDKVLTAHPEELEEEDDLSESGGATPSTAESPENNTGVRSRQPANLPMSVEESLATGVGGAVVEKIARNQEDFDVESPSG